jgi:hypothetical protein
VDPVADPISNPSSTSVVEDVTTATVSLGLILSNSTGIAVVDNGSGSGNNPEPETISQVVLDFPADSLVLTTLLIYNSAPLTGAGTIAGLGSGSLAFETNSFLDGRKKVTITSSLLLGSLGLLDQATRAQAEQDIRNTLALLGVSIGPAHTDENLMLNVTAGSLDVNLGRASQKNNTFPFLVSEVYVNWNVSPLGAI